MRARYGALFAASPALHCKLLHRIVHPPFVVDHEEVHGLGGSATAGEEQGGCGRQGQDRSHRSNRAS